MVKNAFEAITNFPSKIITFSDDMDGLRKVPENIPKKDMLEKYIGAPLTSIPDPFEKYNSFGEHNNQMLKSFLDDFDFDYEFKSSTELYKSGFFDNYLLKVLKNYKKINEIVLPTIGPERRSTYSPILPICKKTGKVLQVPIKVENEKVFLIYSVKNWNFFQIKKVFWE